MNNKRRIMNNKGSATVEASIIIPIMLFFFAILYHWGQLIMLENTIYKAGAQTASYLSEYTYLADVMGDKNIVIAMAPIAINEYIDDIDKVEKYVENGTLGIDFSKSYISDGEITLVMEYKTKVWLPFFKEQRGERVEKFLVKDFTGRTNESTDTEIDPYVYVSNYESVYHTRRDCSHLSLSIRVVGISNIDNYAPCELCGGEINSNAGIKTIIVTEDGDKYHSSISCSGLKRTVTRKKLSEVGGLKKCTRCGQ